MRSALGRSSAVAMLLALFRYSRHLARRPKSAGAGIVLLISLAATAFCGARPAEAAMVTVTITGTAGWQSYDATGVFGPPNTDLTGKPFTAVYTMDDTKGVPAFSNETGCANGPDSSGLSTPVPKAVLTINGKSYTFGALTPSIVASDVSTANAGVPQTIQTYMFRELYDFPTVYGRNILWFTLDFSSIYARRNWESAFSYTLIPPKDSGGALWDIDNSHLVKGAWVRYQHAGGNLTAETVRVDGPVAGENLGCGCAPPPTNPDNLPSSPANPPAPSSSAGVANDPKPNTFSGNLINAATGNAFQTETDFTGAPATGLALTRYYNSQDATKGAFGTGWHSAWERSLNPLSASEVRVTGADGRADRFMLIGKSWQAYSDVTRQLAAVLNAGKKSRSAGSC